MHIYSRLKYIAIANPTGDKGVKLKELATVLSSDLGVASAPASDLSLFV